MDSKILKEINIHLIFNIELTMSNTLYVIFFRVTISYPNKNGNTNRYPIENMTLGFKDSASNTLP